MFSITRIFLSASEVGLLEGHISNFTRILFLDKILRKNGAEFVFGLMLGNTPKKLPFLFNYPSSASKKHLVELPVTRQTRREALNRFC